MLNKNRICLPNIMKITNAWSILLLMMMIVANTALSPLRKPIKTNYKNDTFTGNYTFASINRLTVQV